MTPEAFAHQEDSHRDLLKALGQLSRHHQAPPDFVDSVLEQARRLPVPRRGWLAWVWGISLWPPPLPMPAALTMLLVLALVGAVPQYLSWLNTYLFEEPTDIVFQARAQENMWKKNFDCATAIDRSSSNYAVLDGERVSVMTWTCPSGDVLLTVESPQDESYQRLIWIPLSTHRRMTRYLPWVLQEASAADENIQVSQRGGHIVAVLCQRWQSDRLIKRRIQLANGRCVDEIVNPRTGRVMTRQGAPCDRSC